MFREMEDEQGDVQGDEGTAWWMVLGMVWKIRGWCGGWC